jgi:Cdc6-like AAA superfamily ATPase
MTFQSLQKIWNVQPLSLLRKLHTASQVAPFVQSSIAGTMKDYGERETLSVEQSTLLQLLQSGQNVYFTGNAGSLGKAGTGKTVVIRHFIEYLKQQRSKFAVTVRMN